MSCKHERELRAHCHEVLSQLKDIIFTTLRFSFRSLFHFVPAYGFQYAFTNFEIRSVRSSTLIHIILLLSMKWCRGSRFSFSQYIIYTWLIPFLWSFIFAILYFYNIV
jgi:hypothetical protein